MALVNVGTKENPRWIEADLAWGNSHQSAADHAAEKVATGSVDPNATKQPRVIHTEPPFSKPANK
jgi:hypothetical protein